MQSKKNSLIEVLLNIGSGFILSALFQQYVVTPVWNLHTSAGENFSITLAFTVVSVVRSYIWRRLANRHLKD